MRAAAQIQHVAVIGAGTIGASWTAFFLSRGLLVSVYDPEPARAQYVRQYIEDCWPILQRFGAWPAASPEQWSFSSNLADAAADAEFIQESAPDNFSLKRALFAELDTLARPDVVIASSTSSLLLTDLQQGLARAERFAVAHPFNPPHLIPLVEVVGGRDTALAVSDWCYDFFAYLGKTVLRLRKEVVGHAMNRLQAALFQEAVWLVREGVADISDIDRGVSMGPALRWALMGPFLTFHLGARHEGIRGYLQSLGPAHERMWRDLQHVDSLTPELVDRIARGVDQETAGAPLSELLSQRDRLLTDLVQHMSEQGRRLIP
jgi:3-hydroxyacyl-CoA dehydrogenase